MKKINIIDSCFSCSYHGFRRIGNIDASNNEVKRPNYCNMENIEFSIGENFPFPKWCKLKEYKPAG